MLRICTHPLLPPFVFTSINAVLSAMTCVLPASNPGVRDLHVRGKRSGTLSGAGAGISLGVYLAGKSDLDRQQQGVRFHCLSTDYLNIALMDILDEW